MVFMRCNIKAISVPFSINSLVKWYCTSMCLLLSPILGLCRRSIALVLSQEIVADKLMPSSARAHCSHTCYFAVIAKAIYSASCVDVACYGTMVRDSDYTLGGRCGNERTAGRRETADDRRQRTTGDSG